MFGGSSIKTILEKFVLCGLTPFSIHNYVKPIDEMILGYILT